MEIAVFWGFFCSNVKTPLFCAFHKTCVYICVHFGVWILAFTWICKLLVNKAIIRSLWAEKDFHKRFSKSTSLLFACVCFVIIHIYLLTSVLSHSPRYWWKHQAWGNTSPPQAHFCISKCDAAVLFHTLSWSRAAGGNARIDFCEWLCFVLFFSLKSWWSFNSKMHSTWLCYTSLSHDDAGLLRAGKRFRCASLQSALSHHILLC